MRFVFMHRPEKHPEKNGIPVSGDLRDPVWSKERHLMSGDNDCNVSELPAGQSCGWERDRERERERERWERRGTGGEVELTCGRLHSNEKGAGFIWGKTHIALSQFRKRFSYCSHNGTFFWSVTFYVCKIAWRGFEKNTLLVILG